MENRNQDEVEDDEVENNSYEGHGPSPAWLAQFNKVVEDIQCGMSWFEG